MKKKSLFLTGAILLFSLPVLAVFNGNNLGATLRNLRRELQREHVQMSRTRDKISTNYEEQHEKMVDIIKECNELSLMLYSQKQDYTFDLCYALETIHTEYEDFNRDRRPYDRIVSGLDVEINRYARLIEALRRLPPERALVEEVPDSLAYHNDSLDYYIRDNESSRLERLIEEAARAQEDSAAVFLLNEQGERDRDSCIFYASELLKMYAESRAIVVADSTHYVEAYLHLKESYDYARDYYQLLQKRIFVEGQTPWLQLMADARNNWRIAMEDTRNKYYSEYFAYMFDDDFSIVPSDSLKREFFLDSLKQAGAPADSAAFKAYLDSLTWSARQAGSSDLLEEAVTDFSMQIIYVVFFFIEFFVLWGLAALVLLPVFRFIKPLRERVSREQKRLPSLLLAILLFLVLNAGTYEGQELLDKAEELAGTFMWLLGAIVTTLLIRLKPEQLKPGVKLYWSTIFLALAVIGFRVLFVPNSLMNFVFPPLLFLFAVWQLFACLRMRKRVDQRDAVIGWVSFVITLVALAAAVAGYVFLSLLILVWWYFQLAAILTVVTIWHLLVRYREGVFNDRVREFRKELSYISGPDKESLLFGVTWIYDLVKEVVIPVLALLSFPFCIKLALGVFDFPDLYHNFYYEPFVHLVDKGGDDTLRLTVRALVLIISLFFVFRYLNKLFHFIWQRVRYATFMRKNNRKTIRDNEINLSLGNSIISVLVWMLFITIAVIMLRIPTGSLSLVAGGLSAGIGLALKDIINNFIYGIQLMSGRLRVGDWIECDGVRGTVTSIGYQSTQIETVNGTTISFLNATLFGKSFTNLTKSNAYEFLKILVGVSYGTDIQRVREILETELEELRTKDSYGREVVDPRYGIYVRFGDFGNSAIEVAVKQYVLVSERISYIDRAKEAIYNALNKNGIQIPFPQCDVHLKQDV